MKIVDAVITAFFRREQGWVLTDEFTFFDAEGLMNEEERCRVYARWPLTSDRMAALDEHAPSAPHIPWQGPTVMPDSVAQWVTAQQATKLIAWIHAQRFEYVSEAFYDPVTRRVLILWKRPSPQESSKVKTAAASCFGVAVCDMVPFDHN